eukprot:1015095-Prorocentrum_minimum.AAC.1
MFAQRRISFAKRRSFFAKRHAWFVKTWCGYFRPDVANAPTFVKNGLHISRRRSPAGGACAPLRRCAGGKKLELSGGGAAYLRGLACSPSRRCAGGAGPEVRGDHAARGRAGRLLPGVHTAPHRQRRRRALGRERPGAGGLAVQRGADPEGEQAPAGDGGEAQEGPPAIVVCFRLNTRIDPPPRTLYFNAVASATPRVEATTTHGVVVVMARRLKGFIITRWVMSAADERQRVNIGRVVAALTVSREVRRSDCNTPLLTGDPVIADDCIDRRAQTAALTLARSI